MSQPQSGISQTFPETIPENGVKSRPLTNGLVEDSEKECIYIAVLSQWAPKALAPSNCCPEKKLNGCREPVLPRRYLQIVAQ